MTLPPMARLGGAFEFAAAGPLLVLVSTATRGLGGYIEVMMFRYVAAVFPADREAVTISAGLLEKACALLGEVATQVGQRDPSRITQGHVWSMSYQVDAIKGLIGSAWWWRRPSSSLASSAAGSEAPSSLQPSSHGRFRLRWRAVKVRPALARATSGARTCSGRRSAVIARLARRLLPSCGRMPTAVHIAISEVCQMGTSRRL
jgi:hypothetical protein